MKHLIYPVKKKKVQTVNDFDVNIIKEDNIRNAFEKIKRKWFLPEAIHYRANNDIPLPIGYGQTSSAPGTIYEIVKNLKWNKIENVLEIGTGCGYQTAILAELGKFVYSIELIPDLLKNAKEKLIYNLKYTNIKLYNFDGTKGLEEKAPYDRIIISAAFDSIPYNLTMQLALDGEMILPVGEKRDQRLVKLTRIDSENILQENLCKVTFVPINGSIVNNYE